jgi:hypothetical protein
MVLSINCCLEGYVEYVSSSSFYRIVNRNELCSKPSIALGTTQSTLSIPYHPPLDDGIKKKSSIDVKKVVNGVSPDSYGFRLKYGKTLSAPLISGQAARR